MTYDLAVIGSGPGGCAAALNAARRGVRVCLIERDLVGGVCLNVGCIPTKALITVAQFIRRLKRAEQLGVKVHGYEVDYPAVRARSQRIVSTLRQGLSDLLRREGVELVQGSAAFEQPSQLMVTHEGQTRRLQAKRVLIAAGGRPIPGPWSFDEDRLLSYRGMLSLATLPRSLLIIGGGVIGCEFASCLSMFGVQVTLIEQEPQLLPAEDPEVARWLTRRFETDDITVLTGKTVQQLQGSSTEVSATLADGSMLRAERCLIAIGQRPNLEPLQLDAASIAHGRGVTVDASCMTSQPQIAAIGDCLEGHGLAHWASTEGALAVRSLFGESIESLRAADVPRCIFTYPEIAQAGLTQAQAGEGVRVSRFSFGALGKSHCDDEAEGFVKLLVDPANRLQGATIVGAHASSLIHYAVLAMQHGLTAKQLARTITAHPTLPESITEAAAHLYGESLCVAARSSAGAARGVPRA